MPPERREQLRAWGRKGGQARAARSDFRQHQRHAGRCSAAVNDMAALGARGAKATIHKYGYLRFFQYWRNWKLRQPPTSHERQIMAILDDLNYPYQREAQVLGEHVPVAVDFYLPDANDAIIEINGRIHYDPFFDHPNYPTTRRQNDMHRLRKLERAGFRVLEIDYRSLVNEPAVALKIAGFLIGGEA